jgi:hypothetical protein
MTRRTWRRASSVILVAVCLAVTHDAVAFVELGPGATLTRSLREGGHAYWPFATLFLGAATAVIGLATLVRLLVLADAARGLPATSRRAPIARDIAIAWMRLFTLLVAAFVVQENLEHLWAHRHLSGLGLLIGPEHPLAILVLGVTAALGAIIATLVGGREDVLLSQLAGVGRRPGRAPRANGWRLAERPGVPRLTPLATSIAGRAPPRNASI